MNKLIQINLGKSTYSIEKNAYKLLRDYLYEIQASLNGVHGNEKIIYATEEYISSIFNEKLKEHEIINSNHVLYVVELMGKESSYVKSDERVAYKEEKNIKKLFRSYENRYIAGVCGGLAVYFSLRSRYIRIFLLLLLLFSRQTTPFVTIAYLILWVLIPYAKSAEERLQMEGRPVSFRSIKSFFISKKTQRPNNLKQTASKADQIVEILLNLIFRLVKIGLGVFLILLSLFSISLLFWIYNSGSIDYSSSLYFDLFYFKFKPQPDIILFLGSLPLFTLFLLAMVMGLELLFNFFKLKRSLLTRFILLGAISLIGVIVYSLFYFFK